MFIKKLLNFNAFAQQTITFYPQNTSFLWITKIFFILFHLNPNLLHNTGNTKRMLAFSIYYFILALQRLFTDIANLLYPRLDNSRWIIHRNIAFFITNRTSILYLRAWIAYSIFYIVAIVDLACFLMASIARLLSIIHRL